MADNTLGMEILSEGTVPIDVDIIFVHGLRGGNMKTWTKEKTMWPRDLLAKDIPSARIMSWGYDANVMNFFESTSQSNLFNHSQQLLGDIVNERESADEAGPTLGVYQKIRPILFVGHSLGGLVVKDAICRSHEWANQNRLADRAAIYAHVKGIVFCGVPHRGSSKGAWVSFATKLAEAVLKDHNDKVVAALARGSETTQRLQDDFVGIAGQLEVQTLLEDLAYSKIGKIVDDESAVIGLPNEVKVWIHANHSDMVKFDSRDAMYKRTASAIKQLRAKLSSPPGPANRVVPSNAFHGDTSEHDLPLAVSSVQHDSNVRGHLSFEPGEIIEIVNQIPGLFWLGRINGRMGLFPKNMVMLLSRVSEGPKPPPRDGLEDTDAQLVPESAEPLVLKRTSSFPDAEHDRPTLPGGPSSKTTSDLAGVGAIDHTGPTRYVTSVDLPHIKDAINFEERDRLRRLLGDGFDTDVGSVDRHALLISAITTKSTQLVEFLLDAGAYARSAAWDEELLEASIFSGKAATVNRILDRVHPSIAARNMLSAVSNGRLDVVREFTDKQFVVAEGETLPCLIDGRIDLNLCNEKGWMAVHIASCLPGATVLGHLLERGARVDIQDRRGQTPLHVVAKDLRLSDSIELLVRAPGIDLEARDKRGLTPLSVAVRYWNHARVVRPRDTSLTTDTAQLLKAMTILLDAGCNLVTVSHRGSTPLHTAVRYKSLCLVKLLLDRQADVNAPGPTQWTPLHYAARCEKLQSMVLLLEKGASTERRNEAGWMALHYAACSTKVDMVMALVRAGALINAILPPPAIVESAAAVDGEADPVATTVPQPSPKGDRGVTALHLATARVRTEIVSFLLSRGAALELRAFPIPIVTADTLSRDGYTALHFAAAGIFGECTALVALLLDAGAAIGARIDDSSTALTLAVRTAPDETVALLLDRGSPIEATGALYMTPLMFAAGFRLISPWCEGAENDEECGEQGATDSYLNTMTLLLDRGASVNSRSESGSTVLHFAVRSGRVGRVRLCLERGADVMAKDGAGITAFGLAACLGRGYPSILRFLLECLKQNGLNVEEEKAAALPSAMLKGSTIVIQLLQPEPSTGSDVDVAPVVDDGSPVAITSTESTLVAPLLKPEEIDPPPAYMPPVPAASPMVLPVDGLVKSRKQIAQKLKKGWKVFLS